MRLAGILLSMAWAALDGATLERLSLDDMIQKSTQIVSGKVTGSTTVKRGPVVYTQYRVQVDNQWKGPQAAQLNVSVAGGRQGAMVQTFSGSPQLAEGQEYVL